MTAFLKWLPVILQAIISVQTALPTLQGASKKNLVLGIVTLAAGVAGSLPEDHVAGIGTLIDGSVKLLKDEGVFGKDQPPVLPVIPLMPAVLPMLPAAATPFFHPAAV